MDQYGTYGAESILECNMKIVTRAIAHPSSGSQLRFLAHTPTRTRAITYTAPRVLVHGVEQEHAHGLRIGAGPHLSYAQFSSTETTCV